MGPEAPPLQFILKVTARCNLNCTYCYVFNKADQSWRQRSRMMANDVFEQTLTRIREHCVASGQPMLRVMFHGGEPLLAGKRQFRRWLERLHDELDGVVALSLAVQTNATLIDDDWAQLFSEHGVEVGVSIDGPPDVNDRFRVDHRGNGSFDRIIRGLDALRARDVLFSVLSVLQYGSDGGSIYRFFGSLRPHTINFLFPDQTYEDVAAVRSRYGPHPVADVMLPIVDEWWRSDGGAGEVPLLRNICRILMGGESRSDMFGNLPLGFVFVEVDGEIEGLDVLRVDAQGIASTGMNVFDHPFAEIGRASEFHDAAIIRGVPLPTGCRACHERDTCAGGYLPHRFSVERGFDNPSVWCNDILLLFGELRRLTGVTADETVMRRAVLHELQMEMRTAAAMAQAAAPT